MALARIAVFKTIVGVACYLVFFIIVLSSVLHFQSHFCSVFQKICRQSSASDLIQELLISGLTVKSDVLSIEIMNSKMKNPYFIIDSKTIFPHRDFNFFGFFWFRFFYSLRGVSIASEFISAAREAVFFL